jgi:hypothetical protein
MGGAISPIQSLENTDDATIPGAFTEIAWCVERQIAALTSPQISAH